MAKQNNHYDMAFERLLRLIRRPYVSVNENRRALYQQRSLKSMDFVVYSEQTSNLLIDVKGRRQSWESWTTQEDISSLMEWEQVFGTGFRGLLVFAYDLTGVRDLHRHSVIWDLRGRRYAFYGVWARDYAEMMRPRSPSWQTVSLPALAYEQLRQPLLDLL